MNRMQIDSAQERTLRVLSDWQPLTAYGIAEATGENPENVGQRVRRMYANGQLHIAGYEIKSNGKHWPAYSIGKAKNTPPPRKQTQAEIVKRYYDKTKAERPEVHQQRMARTAAREKARVDSDPEFRAYRFGQIAATKRKARAKNPDFVPVALRLKKNLQTIAEQFGITWKFHQKKGRQYGSQI